jgi:adenylosuccinate lyase
MIAPDATTTLGFMLERATSLVEGLVVYRERMLENLNRSGGLFFSEAVLLALVEKGLGRQQGYELVQRNAMRAWKERRPFFELLAADPKVTDHLSADELKACFDPAFFLKNVDAIFKRLGLAR